MKFRIYRFNPETDAKPYTQDYDVDVEPGMMLLQVLLKIKDELDETLSLRRSCGEGVCQSIRAIDVHAVGAANAFATGAPRTPCRWRPCRSDYPEPPHHWMKGR